METRFLDYALVPVGLITMIAYHLWLLHRIVRHPNKTVIGVNAISRRLWVQAMMEDVSKNGILAVQTLRNNIMASTVLASTAITLCSLIALLMTSGNENNSSFLVVLGDRSTFWFSIKYYSHASILINVPYKKISPDHRHQEARAEYVATTVNRGSYFWSLGLRAFYFSFPLFLWMFGPIPMFLSCFVLVFLLYFLDVTFDFGQVVRIVYYSHASILINVPYKKISPDHRHQEARAEYVATTVNRGSYFWSLGLRAFYFSFPLFLWMFGPIPMFLSCFVLVFLLYFLDVTFDFGQVVRIVCADVVADRSKDEEAGNPMIPNIRDH
ncbi:hypothetical protein CDL15_Pgr021660 [Punica granatum]|uniref:DUF599 domain-containing protein n=1 Tax=Punica granatum TaxID=22663 RepID=A0A218WSB5_PUNGR|nr:hypothetical protein CDL15_Pgr021660 [Punica granatum]